MKDVEVLADMLVLKNHKLSVPHTPALTSVTVMALLGLLFTYTGVRRRRLGPHVLERVKLCLKTCAYSPKLPLHHNLLCMGKERASGGWLQLCDSLLSISVANSSLEAGSSLHWRAVIPLMYLCLKLLCPSPLGVCFSSTMSMAGSHFSSFSNCLAPLMRHQAMDALSQLDLLPSHSLYYRVFQSASHAPWTLNTLLRCDGIMGHIFPHCTTVMAVQWERCQNSCCSSQSGLHLQKWQVLSFLKT